MAVQGKPKTRRARGSQADGFQRRSRPVRVRTGIRDWRSWPWRKIALIAVLGTLSAGALSAVSDYVYSADRFRFPDDGSGLAVSGLERLNEERVREVFAGDFGRPLASLALEARRQDLIALPWVRGATISRIWPDRVWVDVKERQPVAFLRLSTGRRSSLLVDREGVLLDPLPGVQFDLPVVDGIERDMSIEDRRLRVELLENLVAELDGDTPRYGERFGQIDLSDAQNAVATVVHEGRPYELQMGDKLFRHRFEAFLSGVAGWERSYGRLAKVDLRFAEKVFMEPVEESPQPGAGR